MDKIHPMDAEKQNKSTAALFHMVVTMTPALALKTTLLGYNQLISKLIEKMRER